MSTNHNFWRERRAEAVSNRGLSAYQPNALPLGRTGCHGAGLLLLCFFVALRPRKRDGLLGTGTEWEGDERVKARPRKPPEKLRRCPLAIAQRLVTAQLLFQLLCLGRVTKTMSVALLLTNNLDNSSNGSPTFLAQHHLPTHDLFWANLRVQLHLPPVRSPGLLISPGTLVWGLKGRVFYTLKNTASVAQNLE